MQARVVNSSPAVVVAGEVDGHKLQLEVLILRGSGSSGDRGELTLGHAVARE